MTFVKVDAEGSELAIMRGARVLLQSERPPMWMMEYSLPLARLFGHEPEDITRFVDAVSGGRYRAFRIHSQGSTLVPLPDPTTLRFDAVFVPLWLLDRVKSFRP